MLPATPSKIRLDLFKVQFARWKSSTF